MSEETRVQTKPLSEMVVINNGIDYKKNPKGNEEIPIYGTGGIMGFTSIALNEGPAVLTGRKGSINRPFYLEGKFWNVDTIFCLKPLGENHAKWLYYSILNVDMTKLNEATGVPSITSKSLYRLQINYYNPEKQKEIAHILTTCDTVIGQTQSAIAKYKAIKQGLLHDLFTRGLDANGKLRSRYEDAPELYKESELGMIPSEWEVKRLGDYLISLEAGVSVNSMDVSSTNHIAVLKTSSVSGGYFYPNENKGVVQKDIERVKTNPKSDSIIISRMNTPLLVGECGYIENDYPFLFLPDRLWQTVFRDKESICVRWLNFLLNTEKYKKIIKDSATGTSDSMKNITKSAFFELKIPMCIISEQNEIAQRLSSIDNKIRTEETLLQKYQSIKRGLMGDLLGGKKNNELTN
jgi:type I restriction enzyme S subunit